MKKRITMILSLILLLTLGGCGKTESQSPQEPLRDLPEGDYTEIGEGVVNVLTPSGSSENDNVPVLYLEPNTMLVQVGIEAWDFNGGALSYIYIDGMLIAKEQLANTQTSLSLEGTHLGSGVHQVEVVQFANDDPSGEMITYKTMSYEVKEK